MLAYYLHNLDPIIFRISDNVGPRWYGLAYVRACLSSFLLLLWLAKRGLADLPPRCGGMRANRSITHYTRCNHWRSPRPATTGDCVAFNSVAAPSVTALRGVF